MSLFCCTPRLLAGLALTLWLPLARGQETSPPDDRLPPGALARFGTPRLRQPYHRSSAVYIAFSPDGKTLASRSDDSAVHLWDVASGRPLHRLPDASAPSAFAFSPDSRTLVVALGDRLRRWDVTTGKPLSTWAGPEGSNVQSLAFTADGRRLVTGGRVVRIWDLAGKELRSLGEQLEPIVALAVAGDGTIAAGGQRGTVYLWDADGKELRRLPRDGSRLFGLALSPDGTKVAVGTRKIIHWWEVRTGRELHQCGSPVSEEVTSFNNDTALAVSPDGRYLAAVGRSVRRFDLESREFLVTGGPWTVALPQRASAVAFSPDGKRLAVAGGGQEIRFLDAATGRQDQRDDSHQHAVTCLAVSPDGRLAASGARDHSLFLWDVRTGQPRHRLTGHAAALRAVSFSSDGARLASGDAGGSARVWDVIAGKEVVAIQAHAGAILSLALSPDGTQLAAGGADGRLRLYDVARAKIVHEFPRHRKGATAVTFSADGRLLASSDGDGDIRVWQTATGEPEGKPKEAEEDGMGLGVLVRPIQGPPAPLGRVEVLAFTPDSRRLIYWSRDGLFGLWDVAAGMALRRLSVPTADDYLAGISLDGRTIAVCNSDRRLSLRETATGQERALLAGHGQRGMGAAAFTPDRRKLVSAGSDTTALVWNLTGNSTAVRRLTRQELDRMWSELAGDDGRKAYQHIWSIVAGAEEAVPYIRERLKPPAVEAGHIEKLIADLDSKHFPVRDKARAELEELAELAESALRKVMSRKPALEVQQRLERLLDKIKRERYALNPQRLRVLRVIEALEQVGNAQARGLLQTIAEAPPELRLTDEVKLEARWSLRRLDQPARP